MSNVPAFREREDRAVYFGIRFPGFEIDEKNMGEWESRDHDIHTQWRCKFKGKAIHPSI